MKKYIKIISVILVVIAIAGIGVVYGFFNYTRTGQTQKVIAGSLYLTLNEGNDSITLANVFPETKEEARDATLHVPGTATNNTLTFTLKGKNTSENKDINYEILLNNGAETNGKERFETKDLVFDLIEVGENNEETLILDAVSYDELEDQKIWIDKVDKNTTDEIEITYKLRMWISDDVVISESDPDADYTPDEFKNRYASVKVAVEGDLENKVLPLLVGTDNLQTSNGETYFTNVIANNDTTNTEDTFELTVTSSNANVEFGYKDDAVIENISNANIDGKVSKLEINSNSKVKKLANELVITSTFVEEFTIPKNQKATFNIYLIPKYDNDEATDLSFTLKKNNTTVQEFVKHVSLQGTKTGVPQIEFVNREATYSGTSVTLDNVTIKNSDNTVYTGTETYTYYNGTGCSGTALVSAPINAGVYSVKIVAPGVGTDNDAIKCGTIKINKKNLTIKADDKTIPYGDNVTFVNTMTGFVNNETSSILSGTVNYTVKDGDTVVNNVSTLEVGTYMIVPSGTLEANNYNIAYVNGTLTIEKLAQPMTVSTPQSWSPTFSAESTQDKTFTAAANNQGTVTYSIASQVDSESTAVSYFSIPTSTTNSLRVAANTPVGTYTVVIRASTLGTDYYYAGNKDITMTVTIGALQCNAPTNVAISNAGVVTWTASSNCSSATHQVKVASGSYVDATNGVNKNSEIVAETGYRAVYVKAVAPNGNYISSDETSASTIVFSVTLTKGTGIASVTGAGNYISGATVTLGATASTGYTWSKWTQTSDGAQVSTTNAYSAMISTTTGNWAYTANAQEVWAENLSYSNTKTGLKDTSNNACTDVQCALDAIKRILP